MVRLLVLGLLALVAVWLIRRAFSRARDRDAQPGGGDAQSTPAGKIGELVRCARCGVHLPLGEARNAQGVFYCSEEHARLGPGADP